MALESPTAPLSFDAVYRAHAKTVSRWASRLLGPGGDCEDVVQEVFIVVRHKLSRFDGQAEITTWLHAITVRVVQDWQRRRRWWSWVTGRGPSPSRGRPQAPRWSAAEGAHDPVARLELRERVLLLYRILDGLSEAYGTTFILFELRRSLGRTHRRDHGRAAGYGLGAPRPARGAPSSSGAPARSARRQARAKEGTAMTHDSSDVDAIPRWRDRPGGGAL